jgi:hypothetical protein
MYLKHMGWKRTKPLERTWIEQAEHIRSAVTVSPKGYFSYPVGKESAIRLVMARG